MKSLKQLLKSNRVRRVLCWLVTEYLRLVYATGRWRLVGVEAPQRFWDQGQGMIACFWHGRILMMPHAWRWPGPFYMMISGHRDGRLIADTVAHLGIHTISGSTSRGGSSALRGLAAKVKAGATVGITPDGPRGPRMRAQSGIVKLAQLTGAPVFPVTFGAKRRRVMSSWDRFVVAWPFNRGVLIYGEPIFVPRDATPAQLEAARRDIEDALNRITAEADRQTGHAPIEPAPRPAVSAPPVTATSERAAR